MSPFTNPRQKMVLVSGVLAFLAGCSSKPAANLSTAAAAPRPTEAPATVVKEPVAPSPIVSPVTEALPKSVDELNRRGYMKDVFFDFDAYEIRTDQRDVLAKDAAWLKRWPTVKILLEGHCDDRGTDAYNMALGERRAEAAREYLEALGVAPSRVQIVSYGKERPLVAGEDEKDWALNRRDHVLATSE